MIVPASLRPLRMTYTIRYPKNPTASPIEYKPKSCLSLKIATTAAPPTAPMTVAISDSETPSAHPAPPPELGENNGEFLKSLGYDDAKIAEFKEKGII